MNDPTCFVVPGEVAADLDAYLYRRRKAGETLDGALARVIREGIRSASIEDELAELAASPLEIPAIEFPEFKVEDFHMEIPSFEDMDFKIPVYRHGGEAQKRTRHRKPKQYKTRSNSGRPSTRKGKG